MMDDVITSQRPQIAKMNDEQLYEHSLNVNLH
jgi:hypothetical protein